MKSRFGSLAGRWPVIFTQLVDGASLTLDKRVELVDIALANSNHEVNYELGETVRDFFQSRYTSYPTITTRPAADGGYADDLATTRDSVGNAVATLVSAGFVCDDLAALNPEAVRLLVERDSYALTATNLRAVLGDPPTLSLDRIKSIDESVYEDVLEHPDEYLDAIANDKRPESEQGVVANRGAESRAGQFAPRRVFTYFEGSRTRWTVDSWVSFEQVVTDLKDHSEEQIVALISPANPDCKVRNLTSVPETTWGALAACHRFLDSLPNVDRYLAYHGDVDADLAAVLGISRRIAVADIDYIARDDDMTQDAQVEAAKLRVAEAVLNATTTITDPVARVDIVSSLGLNECLPVSRVPAEPGPLLGLLIERRLCEDELASFEHFDTTHWVTLRDAINQSSKFPDFVTPGILDPDSTTRLLASDDIRGEVKRAVLARFDEFVPADRHTALVAAGTAALATNTQLGASQITSIAAGTGDADLVMRLLHRHGGGVAIRDVLGALVQLPEPYNGLASSGAALTFPKDDHHAAVFRRLQNDGLITTKTLPKTRKRGAMIAVAVR